MDDYLQVEAEARNGTCVLRVIGEIDAYVTDSFTAHADELLRAIPGPVVIDLSGLRFADAHGARALVRIIRNLPAGRLTAILSCPVQVRRVLDILGLPPLSYWVTREPGAPASETLDLVDRIRRAVFDATEARLATNGIRARLADTCIRIANTRERADLIREQGRLALANSKATRETLLRSRQGATA